MGEIRKMNEIKCCRIKHYIEGDLFKCPNCKSEYKLDDE